MHKSSSWSKFCKFHVKNRKTVDFDTFYQRKLRIFVLIEKLVKSERPFVVAEKSKYWPHLRKTRQSERSYILHHRLNCDSAFIFNSMVWWYDMIVIRFWCFSYAFFGAYSYAFLPFEPFGAFYFSGSYYILSWLKYQGST